MSKDNQHEPVETRQPKADDHDASVGVTTTDPESGATPAASTQPETTQQEPATQESSEHHTPQPETPQPETAQPETAQPETAQPETAPEDPNVVDGKSTAVARIRTKRKPIRKRTSRLDQQVLEFQPDVVELEHRKTPFGARWTLYAVLLLVVSAVTWASLAKVDRLVQGTGELIPLEDPILIQPIDTAKILELHAEFNDVVIPGQEMVTLDPTYSEAEVAKLTKQRMGLQATVARLQTELAGLDEFDISGFEHIPDYLLEKRLFQDRQNQMRAELQRLEAERNQTLATLTANDAEIDARRDVIAMMEKRVDTDKKLLERDAISEREYEDTMLRYLNSQLELKVALSRKSELEETLEVNAKQRDQLIFESLAQVSSELVQTQQDLSATTEELNKARRSRELSVIRVPESEDPNVKYRVLEKSDVSTGSVVRAGDPIYRLVRVDSDLELEIEIEGKDIARLRADSGDVTGNGSASKQATAVRKASDEKFVRVDGQGNDVRIKFNALPFQRYGYYNGSVRAISEGTFTEQEGPAHRVVYKARIRLTENKLNQDQLPHDFRLIPGMTCTAEIKVGDRRVIDYFLYPLFRSLDGAIREP